MKKIISFVAAVAMLSSLFVTAVSADVVFPAGPATYVATPRLATASEVAALETYMTTEVGDDLDTSYTFYALDIKVTGLGSFTNTGSLAKPTGIIPSLLDYKIDFGSDFDKVYGDGTDIYGVCTGLLSNGAQVVTGETAMLVDYNLESAAGKPTAKNRTVTADEVLVSAIIGVQGTATATVITTTDTCYVLGSYEASKSTSVNKKYWNNLADPTAGGIDFNTLSLTFSSAPTTYTVTFMNGSSQVSTKDDYESGDALVVPSDPTPAAGYTFAGWALGSVDNAVSDLTGATVSADATYYAKFTPIVPSTVTISGATAGTVGTPVVLTAATTPAVVANPAVTWTYVGGTATGGAVSNGSVSATGAGTVIVKATVDSVASADYTVTFTVPVTGITLNKASTTLTVGDTETLVATIAPPAATNQAVDWSSSDNGVATVDSNGVVTAVAKGTATITAETADGGFTDTCTVTVEEAAPPLPGDISIKPGAIIKEFLSGSEHATLKPGQTATVETEANYYVTEFDTNALNFAAYDYAVVAYEEGSEVPHVFDKIIGENLKEVASRINFFVIIKKVTNKDKPITNIVVRAFEQE